VTDKVSYLIATLFIDGVILALGYYFNFEFVAISLVAFSAGRKIGWFLSKYLFFPAPTPLLIVFLVVYGGMVAMAVDIAINHFMPATTVKWIFGYGAGLYVAVPHYGLFHEDDVPPWLRLRHLLMDILPALAFVGFALLFAFGPMR